MALSDVIHNELHSLKQLPQRADFHPEKWVWDHEAYCVHQLMQITEDGSREQKELRLVGIFHDIGKIPTTGRKSEDKGGYITSYGHAEKSALYWDAVSDALTEGTDLRPDVIRWLIDNHMDIKFSDRMKERTLHEKKQEAKGLGQDVWRMGQYFKQADDMLAFFERHGLDYCEDAEAGDDHLEPLERHEEAIGRFEDFVELIVNDIRSWEDSGDGSKEMVIVRGLPGCGKTTFAEMVAGTNGEVFETDEYFVTDNGYDFDPSKLGEAHEWCRQQVEEALENGVARVVVSNTSTEVWEFLDYIKMAAEYGYRVHSIIKENRHRSSSVHGVPQSARNKMENRFEFRLQ
jgi:hypothetical protein